jgi:acyl-CoA synthetase (NDP forming)/GNAT superfamily N-acetyltransferase
MTTVSHRTFQPSVGPVHALLADGTTVQIRPTTPDDLAALRALFAGLSTESIRLRFFAAGHAAGEQAAERLCEPDPDRIALLAVACGPRGENVVGEGEAWQLPGTDTAEVAFTVAEGMRGNGVGTLLLEHLADAARKAGIRRFVAETLQSNIAMKRVITSAGLGHHAEFVHGGTVFHDIDLSEDEAYLEVVADREFRASAASLAPLFRPRSIAVVGAGRTPGGAGRAVLDHLASSGFGGAVYAVNPNADEIAGVACAHAIADLPQPIDLAVVALPADSVVDTAIACGRHGVRALTILSTPVGEAARAVLKAVCRRYGMRLVGPNCLGVAAFDGVPGHGFDATFGPRRAALTDVETEPVFASAGIGVQSGGVGITLLEHLAALGIGTSSFASLGDKADVSGNDLLAWWHQDSGTDLVLLHLESFGNPRKFARYARRVARTKPVLAVTAGRSAAGSRAAASHTAAAVTPAVTREALFRQAGVTATRSVAELLQAAALMASQPLPADGRVAILSNAGGSGVLAADACADAGLVVEEFSEALRGDLADILGPVAAVANPVDAGAGASPLALRAAVERICASGEADAVLLILVPTALADLAPLLAAGVRHGRVPVAAVRADQTADVALVTSVDGERFPSYDDPQGAAQALSHARDRAVWLRRPAGRNPVLTGVRSADASRIVSLYLDGHPEGGWLPPDRAADLLACYGIHTARLVLARDERTAASAAAAWNRPVALKAYWPGLVHKSDVGGVLLNLAGAEDVRAGWRLLHRRLGDKLQGVVVQEMTSSGVELLAGVQCDPEFGPLIGFGVGGTDTDLVGGHSFRLAPLTDVDVAELVDGSRAARLLAGYRGRPAADAGAVCEVLGRLALMAAEQPCVAEAEINPLVAGQIGATAADFRIRVERREAVDPYLRRLR